MTTQIQEKDITLKSKYMLTPLAFYKMDVSDIENYAFPIKFKWSQEKDVGLGPVKFVLFTYNQNFYILEAYEARKDYLSLSMLVTKDMHYNGLFKKEELYEISEALKIDNDLHWINEWCYLSREDKIMGNIKNLLSSSIDIEQIVKNVSGLYHLVENQTRVLIEAAIIQMNLSPKD